MSNFLRRLRRAPLTAFERAVGARLWQKAMRIDLEKHTAPHHDLDAKLIVSLTSHPPRFKYLEPTLKCLLSQSVRPDAVILWLSHGDEQFLSSGIVALQEFGLTIGECENYRVYNKIIPSLMSYPEAYIVTADDDTYYRPTWLAELVGEVDPGRNEVLCHRAHRISVDLSGQPAPYNRWTMNTSKTEPCHLIFPTGVGGVLYSPGVLHPDVTDADQFRQLCPTADDIWLYWMAMRKGTTFRKIGPKREIWSWPGTQEVALHRQNVIENANDRQIANLLQAFGFWAAP